MLSEGAKIAMKRILWIAASLILTGVVAIFNLKFGGNDFLYLYGK